MGGTGQKLSKTLDEGTCLTDEIQHHYEFIKAVNGESTWKCLLCGFMINELEDAQP